MVLSAAVLSACGSSGALNASSLGSDNVFSQLSLSEEGTATASADSAMFRAGGKKGHGKGHGKDGRPGFGAGNFLGAFADLALTDAQKAEIQSIMEAAKANRPERPEQNSSFTPPDAEAIQAVQDKISAAFVSDSFDADALHAEMVSLHPAPADAPDRSAMELARAQQTLDIWNVLTAEQKATVVSKAAEFADQMAEMEANRPEREAKDPAQHLAQLTEALTLSADQQAALTAAYEANRPAEREKPDPQALITLLNSGSATAESIAALHTPPEKVDHNPLTRLETLHSILTAEQRQTFVDNGLLKQGRGPGHGPVGPEMGGKRGGFGGPGGFEGFRGSDKGGRGGHGMMGQRPDLAVSPDVTEIQ